MNVNKSQFSPVSRGGSAVLIIMIIIIIDK